MEVIPLTLFYSLLLAGLFVVLFLAVFIPLSKRPDQDSLLPLADDEQRRDDSPEKRSEPAPSESPR